MNKMNNMSTRSNQAGFTLIELIVVIVILGILAATALPKMGNLTADARGASVKAAAASIKAVVGMAHAKFLAAGSPAAGTSASFEGNAVAVGSNGFPTTPSEVFVAAGITSTDYTFSSGGDQARPVNAKTPANCGATYNPAAAGTGASAVAAGSVSVDVSDC
jgi:MSHA pilin protein MshA